MFYRFDAVPVTEPSVSKHWRKLSTGQNQWLGFILSSSITRKPTEESIDASCRMPVSQAQLERQVFPVFRVPAVKLTSCVLWWMPAWRTDSSELRQSDVGAWQHYRSTCGQAACVRSVCHAYVRPSPATYVYTMLLHYISCESKTTRNVLWPRASVCVSVCLSVRGRMPTVLHGPGCNLGQW